MHLEKLNACPPEINKLETQIEMEKKNFSRNYHETSKNMSKLSKKLGSCVLASKPYYDARYRLSRTEIEVQRASQCYERASSQLQAALETVDLAKNSIHQLETNEQKETWSEMVIHSQLKVEECRRTRDFSASDHASIASRYTSATDNVKAATLGHKNDIAKSRVYYEKKSTILFQQEEQKKLINSLELMLQERKQEYKSALQNLEIISNNIHEERKRHVCEGEEGNYSNSEYNNNIANVHDKSPAITDDDKNIENCEIKTIENCKIESSDTNEIITSDDCKESEDKIVNSESEVYSDIANAEQQLLSMNICKDTSLPSSSTTTTECASTKDDDVSNSLLLPNQNNEEIVTLSSSYTTTPTTECGNSDISNRLLLPNKNNEAIVPSIVLLSSSTTTTSTDRGSTDVSNGLLLRNKNNTAIVAGQEPDQCLKANLHINQLNIKASKSATNVHSLIETNSNS